MKNQEETMYWPIVLLPSLASGLLKFIANVSFHGDNPAYLLGVFLGGFIAASLTSGIIAGVVYVLVKLDKMKRFKQVFFFVSLGWLILSLIGIFTSV